MTDWTAGYLADIGYTYGYQPELNPARFRLALLNAGIVPPKVEAACELGFGQGVAVNLHGAANVAEWHGTDFNPSQAAFAREMAAAAGAKANLRDEAFAEFCVREDLPDFDFIALHGIWSWVSRENRAVIVDFLRRKLKPGGVVYLGYNTQPGWADMLPMRELLTDYVTNLSVPGAGIVGRMGAALEFAGRLAEADPLYFRANRQVVKRLEELKVQDRQYLAHEYFNRDWRPMSVSRVAELLGTAKLSFAASAVYLDHIDALNLSADQQKLLAEIPDVVFRQTVRDFCVNQQFRRDYWIRGVREMQPFERLEAIRAERVVLARVRDDIVLKATGSLGEANLHEAIYRPLLDVLGDHRVKTVGQVEQALAGRIDFKQTLQALMVLIGIGVVHPAQEEVAIERVRPNCDRLNAWLLDRARTGELHYLASPVTGGALAVSRVEQLFLLAARSGKSNPEEWTRFVADILFPQGQRLLKDGKPLETGPENMAELGRQAQEFGTRRLPMYKALQVA